LSETIVLSKSKIQRACEGHSSRLPNEIRFNPINDKDMGFLQKLYGSTREDELAQTDWDDARKNEFIAFQFSAQHKHYMEHFAGSDFLLILRDQEKIGRIYIDRRPDEIRLIDIALITEERGSGLGTQLLQDLMDEAADRKQALSIHVEQFNPAMRLYKRLGFKKLDDYGVYDLMQWKPENAD